MNARRACSELIRRREACLKKSTNPMSDEDCLIEQLEEKRCLSNIICPLESNKFYGKDKDGKSDCALWAEAFAYTRDDRHIDWEVREKHLQAQQHVNIDTKRIAKCRSNVQNLSKCMYANSTS